MTTMAGIHPDGGVAERRTASASLLSPLPRTAVLPPRHPERDAADRHSFPYPRWSGGVGGVVGSGTDRAPDVVRCRGRHLETTIDLGGGGRILSLLDGSGAGYRSVPRMVARGEDARGVGLSGGVELNPSAMTRSPWALEGVHAAVGLPGRLGGDRLRWWEIERASGFLTQVDLHLPDVTPVLLVLVRQVPIGDGAGVPPSPRLVVDDVTDASPLWASTGGTLAPVTAGVVPSARVEGVPAVSWFALAPGPAPLTEIVALLPVAIAALDDPVDGSPGRTLRRGSDWLAAELIRARHAGRSRWDSQATPAPHLPEIPDVAHRRRGSSARQWLHLFRDEGLGMTDRVHPEDVGEAAGTLWGPMLDRAHRREALGDWRVHLRLGELAFLEGDLAAAQERWSWAYSLRPTVWVDRNLALLEIAMGRADLAAVRYLRAQRLRADDAELAIEAVGCLIAARRPSDATVVLDRTRDRGLSVSARQWLLEAEVALATGRPALLEPSLAAAQECADIDLYGEWWAALRR